MNNEKGSKIIVGSTMREKLKGKIKELLRKKISEISASGAAGGSPADGSAGPQKTPHAFGKVKNPTIGLDGYKQVGKDQTGTITEKDVKKPDASKPVGKDAPKDKKEPTPYQPIVQAKTPAEKAADELSADNDVRKKEVDTVAKIVAGWANTRKKAASAPAPKKTDK